MTAQAVVERETTAVPGTEVAPGATAALLLTPMQMAYQLIQSGADLGSVKEMLAMSRELAAEAAKQAFDNAIAEAKAELKPVVKNRDGHNSKYADFAAVSTSVDSILSAHGLSYRHRSAQSDRISVTCILSHKGGHSEETTLSGPPDTSGSKNAIQAIGSTLTYLQRYTLLLALGLATTATDDDGKAAGMGAAINDQQREELSKLMDATGADEGKFMAYFKIEYLAELPSAKFAQAKQLLEQKRSGSGDAVPHGGDDPHLTIKTLEGEHRASVYDWVIQGVKGEIYPCKPDIFAATYEVLAISAGHDHQLGFEDGDQSGSHSGEKHK